MWEDVGVRELILSFSHLKFSNQGYSLSARIKIEEEEYQVESGYKPGGRPPHRGSSVRIYPVGESGYVMPVAKKIFVGPNWWRVTLAVAEGKINLEVSASFLRGLRENEVLRGKKWIKDKTKVRNVAYAIFSLLVVGCDELVFDNLYSTENIRMMSYLMLQKEPLS